MMDGKIKKDLSLMSLKSHAARLFEIICMLTNKKNGCRRILSQHRVSCVLMYVCMCLWKFVKVQLLLPARCGKQIRAVFPQWKPVPG